MSRSIKNFKRLRCKPKKHKDWYFFWFQIFFKLVPNKNSIITMLWTATKVSFHYSRKSYDERKGWYSMGREKSRNETRFRDGESERTSEDAREGKRAGVEGKSRSSSRMLERSRGCRKARTRLRASVVFRLPWRTPQPILRSGITLEYYTRSRTQSGNERSIRPRSISKKGWTLRPDCYLDTFFRIYSFELWRWYIECWNKMLCLIVQLNNEIILGDHWTVISWFL